jgi:threonine dehydratase
MSNAVPDFEAVLATIGPKLHRTPIITSATLSHEFGERVYLKAEFLQKTGSYKVRGPLNVLSTMSPGDMAKGVICASAGNHAQRVAYAARVHRVEATVVMASVLRRPKWRRRVRTAPR